MGSRRDVSVSQGATERVIFLCGDVMLGRGVDQILEQPLDPRLHEEWVQDARTYVELAEAVSGPIPRGVGPRYVWGDALAALEEAAPQARVINLETAVTTSDRPWPGKGIHYRTHPAHVACLTEARIDCCVLANNHVLDWGREGLVETLAVLEQAGVAPCGAGRDSAAAFGPVALPLCGGGRLLVVGLGAASSGIPWSWRAQAGRPGVALLDDLAPDAAAAVAARVREAREPGDLVVVSIHWGPNWVAAVDPEQQAFARALIDGGGADVVHGHSSHHVTGIEVYRERLILYGCGDFLNDYEGIGGYESFRGDLALMYLPALDPEGRLVRLRMIPTRTRRFRAGRASAEEGRWLRDALRRAGARLGTSADLQQDGSLALRW